MSAYPFVYVEVDGTARELHPDERAYLETEFEGADGARPYIKTKYEQLDGQGELSGYLYRSELPAGLSVKPAPLDDAAEDTPSFRELTETILEVHGPGDKEFQSFWSDVYDGLSLRAMPAFWKAMRLRNPSGSVREVVASWGEDELRALYRPLLRVDLDDYALIGAAADHNVHLSKNADGNWKVGMMPNLEPLTDGIARQAETFLSGDRIRLPDGREFKRVMTTAEAREAFGLDPKAG